METVDAAIIERTNASQKPTVIFIHGLWSKPSFWHGWADIFEAAGYAPLAPGWPAELGGAAAPETIGQVAAHFARIAGALDRRPALIGHSLGGLIAKTLAGRGLSAATVAIEPAPFRGGLPLPVWTEAPVDAEAAERGPLLTISRERDRTAPPSVTRAAHERQKRNKHAVTEYVQLPRRGRSLSIDSGWQEMAQTALTFVRRFA
jgi:pimeloyl-ACP methyl ester carboxylesterase